MKEAHLREIENVRFTFPLLTFFHPVLEKLSDGNVIRTSIAFALRVVAALTVLGGIVLLFLMLKEVFRFETAGEASVKVWEGS
jgi:predicted lysophospholipase L1 biosynthesis ABC-type transport system permease subunit